MTETIHIGEIAITLTRKDVKHVHLSAHPPSGRVTLVAPKGTRIEVARAYALSKLDGYVISRLNCVSRRGRHPASTLSVRVIISGAGATCFLSGKRRRSPPSVSAIATSRSRCAW